MQEFVYIQTEGEWEAICKIIDWEHAFIREAYLISPSYIDSMGRGIVAPDVPPSMKMIILAPSHESAGLELVFDEIITIKIAFSTDLDPALRIEGSRIKMIFNRHDAVPMYIISRSVKARTVGADYFGYQLRYGNDNMFDESGIAVDK